MIFDKDKLLVIAGPCALENEPICREVAQTLLKVQSNHPGVKILFSGSFDKANRTSLDSLRGPGLEEGLRLLKMVKDDYGFKVMTDFHEPYQAEPVAQVCDALQIPAFLSRQTDLVVAAAKTGKAVNVKKGQFMSPQEMEFVVKKLELSGAPEIWQTDRGTFFGYQNLVVDMRSFSMMERYGHPTIFDATHSVHLPGAAGGKSGGQREFVQRLSQAACAAGAQGLYVETHPNPDQAISDAQTQIPLAGFEAFLEACYKVWVAVR